MELKSKQDDIKEIYTKAMNAKNTAYSPRNMVIRDILERTKYYEDQAKYLTDNVK